MIGTIISFLIAILIWSHLLPTEALSEIWMIIIVIPFWLMIPLGSVFAWAPLQQAEQNSTPRLLEMFRNDRFIKLCSAWLIIFPLLTIGLTMQITHHEWVFALWLIGFGIAIDVSYYFVFKVMRYLNPLDVVQMFTAQAKESILKEREIDLCDWVEAISEVSHKAIQKHSIAITHASLSELQTIARIFLVASKSVITSDQNAETKLLGIKDKVGFTMFFLYQRFDSIFERALKNRLEATCSLLFTLIGKIAVDAAKYDLSLASAPLRFIGKFGKKAQDEGMEEAVLTASCVLLEVAKVIMEEIDITYFDIKDPFLSIINGLEVLSKGSFSRNKQIDIALLKQPFQDLRILFEIDKAKQHQDTPVILQNIDRVLGEFEALQMVMITMPKIPTVEPKT